MALLSCTVGTRIPGFLLQVLAGTWVLLLCLSISLTFY